MKLKSQVLIVVSLCCFSLLAVKGLELAFADADRSPDSEANHDRTVSTSGTVTTSIMPDTIYWNLSLRDRNPEVQTVKKESDAKLDRILSLKKELGFDEDDMQVCHMQLHKRQETRDNGRTVIEYFEITRNVTVRQTDLTKFNEVLSAFVAVGEIDVTYRMASSEVEAVRRSVRKQALQVAQEKANSAAKELGVELGVILTVNDRHPQPAANSYGGTSYRGQTADVQSGVVAPSAIDVTASVDVVYELQ